MLRPDRRVPPLLFNLISLLQGLNHGSAGTLRPTRFRQLLAVSAFLLLFVMPELVFCGGILTRLVTHGRTDRPQVARTFVAVNSCELRPIIFHVTWWNKKGA